MILRADPCHPIRAGGFIPGGLSRAAVGDRVRLWFLAAVVSVAFLGAAVLAIPAGVVAGAAAVQRLFRAGGADRGRRRACRVPTGTADACQPFATTGF